MVQSTSSLRQFKKFSETKTLPISVSVPILSLWTKWWLNILACHGFGYMGENTGEQFWASHDRIQHSFWFPHRATQNPRAKLAACKVKMCVLFLLFSQENSLFNIVRLSFRIPIIRYFVEIRKNGTPLYLKEYNFGTMPYFSISYQIWSIIDKKYKYL